MKSPLRIAMQRSKDQEPPALHLRQHRRAASSRGSSVLSVCDWDDEGFMSSVELPSRPPSVPSSAGTGPYCPRRPTLQEVLANVAPRPWTLGAFMAYLAQSHCLETLEFTMDVQRYQAHYNTMIEMGDEGHFVCMLWQKLLDAYITPNGSRQVNLHAAVRDRLLSLPYITTPPNPAELDPAVKVIHDLMDESVLTPFLNSIPPVQDPESLDLGDVDEAMSDTYVVASRRERSLTPSRMRYQREASPAQSSPGTDILSPSPRLSPRASQHGHSGRPRSSLLSTLVGLTSATSSAEPFDSMTDVGIDSASSSGPGPEPIIPSNTPPTSHIRFDHTGSLASGCSGRPEESSWKKMGARLGWKKSHTSRSSSSSLSGRRSGDSELSRASG